MGTPRADETRVECDVIIVTPGRGANDLLVQFASKAGGSPIGFAGPVTSDDGTLSVERLYLRAGVETRATGGHCKPFRGSGGNLEGITCVGWAGARAYVANFRTASGGR